MAAFGEVGMLSNMTSEDNGKTWPGAFIATNIEETNNVLTLTSTYEDLVGNKGPSNTTATFVEIL